MLVSYLAAQLQSAHVHMVNGWQITAGSEYNLKIASLL